MNTQPNTEIQKKAEEGMGAFIGSIIIVIVLMLFAGYFFHDELAKQAQQKIEDQKIQQQNAKTSEVLNSIEQQLSVPEPEYIN